jgi:N-acetyl-anhydromuramyl-L-alanine amidase AmpD
MRLLPEPIHLNRRNLLCWAKLPALLLAFVATITAGCRTVPPRPGEPAPRRGDEIVVAGQFFHTGTPVVLWTDPGGYDAYRVERRFAPFEKSSWDATLTEVTNFASPNRYGLRGASLTPEQIERFRGGGWDLKSLQGVVDQFVLHYDVCGVSRTCFKVLHDARCLSVHFMLDVDGTIYQTLDLKERAWHASTANDRSVGVEIAHIGAYPVGGKNPYDQWYSTNALGETILTLPARLGDGGIRTPNFQGQPARPGLIRGNIQGSDLEQYDFTPEQYDALVKLTATLCKVFPKLRCDYPQDGDGAVIPRKLDDEALREFQGVLGHYHIQRNKTDPGPAMDWERVVGGARELIEGQKQLPPLPPGRGWR